MSETPEWFAAYQERTYDNLGHALSQWAALAAFAVAALTGTQQARPVGAKRP